MKHMPSGRGSRALVNSAEQIIANTMTLHAMASGTFEERRFHHDRVKNGKVFVAIETEQGWIYAPSRFCGFPGNDMRHMDPKTYRHGSETNVAIRQILGAELGPEAREYPEVDAAYESYCSRFGIEPSLHRMNRRYWISSVRSDYPDEAGFNRGYQEGSAKNVTVNKYERNPEARRICISHYGHKCSVCAFDFERIYGEIGKEFIHVHHLKPLHEIGAEYLVDPVKDLRPVCPNCHAMLHRLSECLSIEMLQSLLQKARSG